MNTGLQLASLNVEALDERELQQIEGGIVPLVAWAIGAAIVGGLAAYAGYREAEDKQYAVCKVKK